MRHLKATSFICRAQVFVTVVRTRCVFAFVCFVRCCAGLLRLLWGTGVTVVFVGVTCDEPTGIKKMAHSQTVFFLLRFHCFSKWMLLLHFIGFRLVTLASTGPFQLPFTIVRIGVLWFAFLGYDRMLYTLFVAPVVCGLFEMVFACFCLFSCS